MPPVPNPKRPWLGRLLRASALGAAVVVAVVVMAVAVAAVVVVVVVVRVDVGVAVVVQDACRTTIQALDAPNVVLKGKGAT